MSPRTLFFFGATAAVIATIIACNSDAAHPAAVDDSKGAGPSPTGASGSSSTSTGDAGVIDGSLAFGTADIHGVAVTASDAYFVYTDPDDGGVTADGGPVGGGILARVPRTGGTTQVVVSGGTAPRALTMSNDILYWLDDEATTTSLIRYGGGTLGAIVSGLTSSSVFTLNGDVLYVATPSIGQVSIDNVPNGDGGASQNVGVATGDYAPIRLLVDGTSIYMLASSTVGGAVLTTPLIGGVPEVIWTAGTGSVRDFAIAGGRGYVAWDKGDASEITSFALSSGIATTLVSPIPPPLQLAIDGTDLFYTGTDGTLSRSPLDSGAVTTLASNLGTPSAIAVADAVYVATGINLVRVPR